MEPLVQCSSCSASLPRTFDRMCSRCGWDNQVAVRKCLRCKAMIILNETLGIRAVAGVAAIAGLAAGWVFGPVRGAAAGLGAGALCSAVTLASLRYRCGGCGHGLEGRLRSPRERRSLWLRRLAYLLGAVALAAASAAVYLRVTDRSS